MLNVDTYWNHIGFTRVIQEATYVAIKIGVDAMLLENSCYKKNYPFLRLLDTHLSSQIKKVVVIGATIRLSFSQYFTSILHNKSPLWYIYQSTNAPTLFFLLALEYLERQLGSILDNSILAYELKKSDMSITIETTQTKVLNLIAPTNVITLENHSRIIEIEFSIDPSIRIVPIVTGNLTALTLVGSATVRTRTYSHL